MLESILQLSVPDITEALKVFIEASKSFSLYYMFLLLSVVICYDSLKYFVRDFLKNLCYELKKYLHIELVNLTVTCSFFLVE